MSETNQAAIVVKTNPNVQTFETKFRFNKDSFGNRRDAVEFKSVPAPSAQGIVAILEAGGKGLDLLIDNCKDTVRAALQAWVNETPDASEETVDWNKFSWDAIANQSKAERATIDEDTWKAFAADYIQVMPGVTGKALQTVTNATIVYLKKFSIIKTDKESLNKLKDQLALYMEHSPNAEKFVSILELLDSKLKTYLMEDTVEAIRSNL